MKTDWDAYYQKPFVLSKYSRRHTGRLLEEIIRRYADGKIRTIVELGGANSCFLGLLKEGFQPERYLIVDTNQKGLDLVQRQEEFDPTVVVVNQDVLDLHLDVQADLVLSVGLIEHFNAEDTRRAIQAHFEVLRPGGLAVITFPTPTWLYRASRWTSEALGMWMFPDERPLRREEVAPALQEAGELLYAKINWPIFFTQMIMAARKRRDR